MLNLESKYFNEYYGNNPRLYNVGFLHYNIELFDEDYSNIKELKDLEKQDPYDLMYDDDVFGYFEESL